MSISKKLVAVLLLLPSLSFAHMNPSMPEVVQLQVKQEQVAKAFKAINTIIKHRAETTTKHVEVLGKHHRQVVHSKQLSVAIKVADEFLNKVESSDSQ